MEVDEAGNRIPERATLKGKMKASSLPESSGTNTPTRSAVVVKIRESECYLESVVRLREEANRERHGGKS